MVKRLSDSDQNNSKLTNVPTPVSSGDAANKKYVDDNATSGAVGASQPAVPKYGSRLLGIGVDTVGAYADDLKDFFTATGQDSISSWSNFVADNGSFSSMLGQYETIASQVGDVNMEVAWSFPGSTNLAGIALGNDDAYIIARAEEIARHGRPTFMRLNWEANGNWYTYSAENESGVTQAGNSPADYVAAWQRTVTIFKKIAPNASFVWCPHLWDILLDGVGDPKYAWDSWYPGDAYVDWIAATVYMSSADWSWVEDGPNGIQDIADFAIAHHKPMRICEWGVGQTLGGTMPADNVDDVYKFLAWLKANPVVREINYFQMSGRDGVLNYRIQEYPNSLAAYTENLVNESVYGYWGQKPYISSNKNGREGDIVIPYPLAASVEGTSATWESAWSSTTIFDPSAYGAIKSVKLVVALQQEAAGTYKIDVRLGNSNGDGIVGTEMTATLPQWSTQLLTSGDIKANLSTGQEQYYLQFQAAAGGSAGAPIAILLVTV